MNSGQGRVNSELFWKVVAVKYYNSQFVVVLRRVTWLSEKL